jgi:hypothetical protein
MSWRVNESSLYKRGLSFIALECLFKKKSAMVYHLCLSNGVFVVKKMFSCVLHTANTLTCFERFFYIKNIGSFENVFSHGFLKHNKNYFLAFLDFTTCL